MYRAGGGGWRHQGFRRTLLFPQKGRWRGVHLRHRNRRPISLVLQTIIPSLLFSSGKTRVTLLGGTHVPFSPSFHYLAEIFAPFLRKLGFELRLDIEAYGFYPRGGVRVRAKI
jgi:RNA 3'-terminal phosphate cyclase